MPLAPKGHRGRVAKGAVLLRQSSLGSQVRILPVTGVLFYIPGSGHFSFGEVELWVRKERGRIFWLDKFFSSSSSWFSGSGPSLFVKGLIPAGLATMLPGMKKWNLRFHTFSLGRHLVVLSGSCGFPVSSNSGYICFLTILGVGCIEFLN